MRDWKRRFAVGGRNIANASSRWRGVKGKMTIAAVRYRDSNVRLVGYSVGIVLDHVALLIFRVG